MSFLLAMQAAGMVTSFLGSQSEKDAINMGRELEKSQFEANMEALRLANVEESLAETQAVRKNIGSQIVNNAAKGNRGGSSWLGINESYKNLQSDERIRSINLLAKETSLTGGDLFAEIKANAARNKSTTDLLKQYANQASQHDLDEIVDKFNGEGNIFGWSKQ